MRQGVDNKDIGTSINLFMNGATKKKVYVGNTMTR